MYSPSVRWRRVPVKPLTADEEQKIWGTDSVANKMADKMVNESLNMLVSDKLDSLVHTWYIKNAFAYDKTEFDSLPESIKTYLPDSVYVSRLQAIDSFSAFTLQRKLSAILLVSIPSANGNLPHTFLGFPTIISRFLKRRLRDIICPHELKYLPIIEIGPQPKK